MSILTINHLHLIDDKSNTTIVKDVSFSVLEHSCLGIVGESGSGKTMTAKEILGVNPPWIQAKGEIIFENQNVLTIKHKDRGAIRGKKISMILQDAMTAFNPIEKIGKQMRQTFMQLLHLSRKEAKKRCLDGLEKMNFSDPYSVYEKYPHELSGGMLQRCMIAIALMLEPQIIIADEPTTALDSINQLEVVKQFQRLRELTGTTLILISHDLGVVQRLAEHIVVMKDGELIESGDATSVFHVPKHPYTQYLVNTRMQLSDSYIHSLRDGVNAAI